MRWLLIPGHQSHPDWVGLGRSREEVLAKLTKYLLTCEAGEDHSANLESLIRQMVKEFPFHQSTLFVGIVKTLAGVPIVSPPPSTSLPSQGT